MTNITRLDFIFLMSDRQNAKDCPTVNEARCYGGDGLLTQFLQLRECHAQTLPALFPFYVIRCLMAKHLGKWRLFTRVQFANSVWIWRHAHGS